MSNQPSRAYIVKQYFYDNDNKGARNEDVHVFSDLTTHHPKANFRARMVDGVLRDVEVPEKRSHAFLGGNFQEVETLRTDEYRALKKDQVLLIKDLILEDEPAPGHARTRVVDVPAPIAGYVSRRDDRNGLVEITDSPNGDVIARVRHLQPISVSVGDKVAYGQTLGIQNEKGLKPGTGKHVHVEIDTRYYRQFENYIADLASGRLPVETGHRKDIQPLPVIDDGVIRLGESNDRIRDLQRVMSREGYRAAGGGPLDQDGVYRPGMQGALLDFQRHHGLPQTGDIDPATLYLAPPVRAREYDRQDYYMPGRFLPLAPELPTAPGHPDHPDHRARLPKALEPAVNQHSERLTSCHQAEPTGSQGPFSDAYLNRAYAAAINGDDAEFSRVAREFTNSPEGQRLVEWSRELYAQQQQEQLQRLPEQQLERTPRGPVMSR